MDRSENANYGFGFDGKKERRALKLYCVDHQRRLHGTTSSDPPSKTIYTKAPSGTFAPVLALVIVPPGSISCRSVSPLRKAEPLCLVFPLPMRGSADRIAQTCAVAIELRTHETVTALLPLSQSRTPRPRRSLSDLREEPKEGEETVCSRRRPGGSYRFTRVRRCPTSFAQSPSWNVRCPNEWGRNIGFEPLRDQGLQAP